MLLVSVKIFTIALLSFGPALPAYSSAITSLNVINLTNQSRMAFNLSHLSESVLLVQAAQAKANDMADKGYFSHQSPDGRTPWDFIQSTGYNYLTAGENLAVNFSEAESIEDAWMNSPGHKANILNKNFEEIGIGIAQGQFQGHTATFVVQMFGVPVEQKISINQGPTRVQAVDISGELPSSSVKAGAANPASNEQVAVAKTETEDQNSMAGKGLAINQTQIFVDQGKVAIRAQVSDNITKVLATFGQAAIMLEPKSQNFWEGKVDLQRLAQGKLSVKVQAFDMSSKVVNLQLADFSNNTVENYRILGETKSTNVQWLGKIFDLKAFENRFYLLFIAGILSSLVLAIGIHRKIQHLGLIANSSFVVILATLLWLAG